MAPRRNRTGPPARSSMHCRRRMRLLQNSITYLRVRKLLVSACGVRIDTCSSHSQYGLVARGLSSIARR